MVLCGLLVVALSAKELEILFFNLTAVERNSTGEIQAMVMVTLWEDTVEFEIFFTLTMLAGSPEKEN